MSLVRWIKFPQLDFLVISYLELASIFKGILDYEFAVFPPFSKVAAMPDDTTANTRHC